MGGPAQMTDDAVLARYVEHLAAADRDGALQVAKAVADSGAGVDAVLDRLVVPGQIEVGKRWERNEWTVPQEHAATAISEWVVATLASQPEANPSGTEQRGRLVAVCAEGEWHNLPVRVLTEVVRRAGWDVRLLGPSVPTGQLSRYIHDEGPDGLLLSCSIPFNLPGARRVIEASRATGTPVMAGGRAFGADGRRAAFLGADAWASTARDAVEELERWNPFTTPAAPLTHAGLAEHVQLERERQTLVDASLATLTRRFPGVTAYSAEQAERTVEDLDYLLRFVSAALLVDDIDLLVDYVEWLEVVLTSRAVPPTAVVAGLDAAAEATAHLPTASGMLSGAADRWRSNVARRS